MTQPHKRLMSMLLTCITTLLLGDVWDYGFSPWTPMRWNEN